MATNTTNFNLSKPAYTDTADIAVINNNMDKVDTALQGLGSGLAIISKSNTHSAITSGQYVYVHGHSSLAEGLYKATTNISANATLSNSNLTAVLGGMGAQVASLSDQFANIKARTMSWQINNADHTITFSGSAVRRGIFGTIYIATPSVIYKPIVFGFTGSGSATGIIEGLMVEDNNLNVTANGLVLTVPKQVSNNYGRITIVTYYDISDLTITFA